MSHRLQTVEQQEQEKEKLLRTLARLFVDNIFEARAEKIRAKSTTIPADKK